MSTRPHSHPAGLALIRVLTGQFLFFRGWSWVQDGSFDGQLVLDRVRASVADASGLVEWWGNSVVLANPDASALFWRWAALICGALLVLGAFTRPAGYIASFFLCQALLFAVPGEGTIFLPVLFACLGCAVAGAGRDYGLDQVLDESCPGWLTWTKGRKKGGLFD